MRNLPLPPWERIEEAFRAAWDRLTQEHPEWAARLHGLSRERIRQAWIESQQRASSTIPFFGLGEYELHKVDFGEAFVEVELVSAEEADKIRRQMAVEHRQGVPDDDFACLRQMPKHQRQPAFEAIRTSLRQNKHVFLVGAAATGKTTLAKYLVRQALRYWDQAQNTANQEADFAYLPYYISLARWAQNLSEGGWPPPRDWRDLVKWIAHNLAREIDPTGRYNNYPEIINLLLLNVLEKTTGEMAFLFLLDGLDEIAPTLRDRIAKRLLMAHEGLSLLPHVRFIVTSRGIFWPPARLLNADFQIMRLLPFTDRQSRQYMRRWLRAAGARDLAKQTQHYWRIIEEDAGLYGLACRPLFLAMICALIKSHHERGRPSPFDLTSLSREMIYREALRALLEEWDKKKAQNGVQRYDLDCEREAPPCPSLKREEKERIFQFVAFQMHQRPSWALKRADIVQTLSEAFKAEFAAERERQDSALPSRFATFESWEELASDFLAHIPENYGIIVPTGDGYYAFAHRSFQEYYTAEYILRTEDWPALWAHLSEEAWREVLLIVLRLADLEQLRTLRSRCKEVLQSLLEEGFLYQLRNWLRRQLRRESRSLATAASLAAWIIAQLEQFWEHERERWQTAETIANRLAAAAEAQALAVKHWGGPVAVLEALVGDDIWSPAEMESLDDIEQFCEGGGDDTADDACEHYWEQLATYFNDIAEQAEKMHEGIAPILDNLLPSLREALRLTPGTVNKARRASVGFYPPLLNMDLSSISPDMAERIRASLRKERPDNQEEIIQSRLFLELLSDIMLAREGEGSVRVFNEEWFVDLWGLAA